MAWLAVNKNGVETISPEKPERDFNEWSYYAEICVESEYGTECYTIDLPRGTIIKLIGRELTWNDEPVEITDKKYYNTIDEVKEAVDNGVTVCYNYEGCSVIKQNNEYILFYKSNTTLIGSKIECLLPIAPESFFSMI